jgi:tartrate dehydratase alpha subunit/fumarate hydratase class I-like protein
VSQVLNEAVSNRQPKRETQQTGVGRQGRQSEETIFEILIGIYRRFACSVSISPPCKSTRVKVSLNKYTDENSSATIKNIF